ncbi:arrestin domain-containing protein 17 [Bombus vancouverensis nearcticus]|uniref:Arrestin domain-containing protein 17-like isoform X1 n=1 Tax=Bombus bifarius TaxID=103933 RepID=A0A6P8MZA0_9HYME|nr:arrestin domain-containing protein 17-like isoform X1 [Bombus vancouverensis nearcticus]XP_033185967.1 arrestin domain-containing protein 17-like isoform X1 [Bombus vancouverensis nearcticus]XP_033319195.1 arrestin domain-containing protein 17-like isoform X1 [Bombus bifarius]XP_033319196.1 arrestin domain-containing protein 17-like isoform X1 [Bombus bifarius]
MDEIEAETDRSIAATLSKSIGFQRIEVILDHPQKVCYSGNQISGNVRLDLDEPTSALGIRLKCKGEAQVYFTDRSAGIRRKFSAFENYLHVETYLAGDGKEKTMITGGVYPFSLTLPENLPCSFEGRYGRVRYSIRALLDVTTIYRFSTNIIPFTVAPILDLNRDPLAPLPISIKQSKMYIGQTEPISMSMTVPVRGYVPGQTIPIEIVVTNPTTVVVTKIRVVFKKVVSYRSTEKSRKHKEIVVEVEQPVNKDSDTYDVTFDVPAVPPTGMIHCNIIDVLYTLKVEACVDVSEWYYRMFQKNLKLRTNIVVGTVPLQNYEIPQKTADVTEAFSFHPPCAMATEEYANDTPSLKNIEREETTKPSLSLPLYEKSQIYRSSKPDRDDPTGDDGDSDGEVKPYSPMYRVYTFESSQKKDR